MVCLGSLSEKCRGVFRGLHRDGECCVQVVRFRARPAVQASADALLHYRVRRECDPICLLFQYVLLCERAQHLLLSIHASAFGNSSGILVALLIDTASVSADE